MASQRVEIGWKEKTEDGQKRQVSVRHDGKGWVFYERERRYDSYSRVKAPSENDWETLLEAVERRGLPQWLEIDAKNFTGVVKAVPTREDITIPIQEQLIVELYSK